jgi:hypothetical protein
MNGDKIAATLTKIFVSLTHDLNAVGWREHEELVKAYMSGLDWFANFDSKLDRAWQRYLDALDEEGFSGGAIDKAFEEHGVG